MDETTTTAGWTHIKAKIRVGHADNNYDNSCSCQYITGKLYEHIDLRGGSRHETPHDSSDDDKHTAVNLTKGTCNY